MRKKDCFKLSLLFVIVLLSGCIDQQRISPSSSAGIWDSSENKWITEEQLSQNIKATDFTIVGELHQSPSFREKLVDVLTILQKQAGFDTLAVDLFPENLPTKDKFSLEWLAAQSPHTINQYQRLFSWADSHSFKVVGVATPVSEIKALKVEQSRNELMATITGILTKDQQNELREILTGSHNGFSVDDKAKINYMLAAHQLKDYTMAEALIRHKKKVVLLSRAFHARSDLGINRYIKASQPNSMVKSILMYSPEDQTLSKDKIIEEMKPYYDLALYGFQGATSKVAPTSHT